MKLIAVAQCELLSPRKAVSMDRIIKQTEMEIRFDNKIRVILNGAHFVPVWDSVKSELRVGSLVIKRFRWPAANQSLILEAFENEGWPDRIHDPLPQHPEICPKRRLHDTIKCLNRNQLNQVIKFRGDGTGRGVLIEVLDESLIRLRQRSE